MKAEYLTRIPDWYKDNNRYDLILSDDIDSLASCMILKQIKDWNIEYFYNFNSMGKTKSATNEAVGIDIALYKGKCIDNHVTMLHKDDYYNPESINPNIIEKIHRNNYFYKYCGSTLLLVWSLLNIPLPKSEEGKMILLTIDSTFKGFYSKYPKPIIANRHFLCDVLNLEELYKVQQRHKEWEFDKLFSKYKLKSKIKYNNEILATDIRLDDVSRELGIPLYLPTDTFYKYKDYYNIEIPLDSDKRSTTKLSDISNNIFSNTVKGKDKIKYSTER